MIKTPVRYDDNQLAVVDADGETLCQLDNWLDEIDMDGKRRGDQIADAINGTATQSQIIDVLTAALTKLGDCDWVITLPDRMDGVREIARTTLAEVKRIMEGK